MDADDLNAITVVELAPVAPTYRFDIVVFNYERPQSFFSNIGKLAKLAPERDRLNFVSASPSTDEERIVNDFARQTGVESRFIPRENWGIDQGARVDYFTGQVGGDSNFDSEVIFQMQDHYLDLSSSFSSWGPEYDNRIKGDVVPDGIAFDLDAIHGLFAQHDLDGAFCDRNDPAWFQLAGDTYVAPSGGNFLLATRALAPPRQEILRMRKAFENISKEVDYIWSLYAEFKWGQLFFSEGTSHYDLKRRRLFTSWPREDFCIRGEDIEGFFRTCEPSLPRAAARRIKRLLSR